jgi:hypothetical protein
MREATSDKSVRGQHDHREAWSSNAESTLEVNLIFETWRFVDEKARISEKIGRPVESISRTLLLSTTAI